MWRSCIDRNRCSGPGGIASTIAHSRTIEIASQNVGRDFGLNENRVLETVMASRIVHDA